jgi:hypothetical protein
VSAARLQGTFQLEGIVTVAHNVAGEHVGDIANRYWTFTPLCPTGPCARVKLVRTRGTSTDTLVLRRRAPAFYTGSGTFYAPLRCGTRTYLRGEQVPFKITVRITKALLLNGIVVAARVNASYTNRGRMNLTPCVAALGHDAATYHGHLEGS